MPVVVVAAAIGGAFIVRHGLSPIQAITQQAEGISSRTFGERLPVPRTGDEIESLAISLNRMISRLEEAFEHINHFTADVSHELRTPLAILRGELEGVARRRGLPPDLLDTVGSALEEVQRLTRIIDHLLLISRLDAGEVLPKAFVNMASCTRLEGRLLAEEKSITIAEHLQPHAWVEGDRLRLQQLIVNLLDNAIKYTREDGCVVVTVNAGTHARVTVEDNGVGIPSDSVPHVFDCFYRADKARARDTGGAGLGLRLPRPSAPLMAAALALPVRKVLGACLPLSCRWHRPPRPQLRRAPPRSCAPFPKRVSDRATRPLLDLAERRDVR